MVDVHLTYALSDRAIAARLAETLREAGLTVSFDSTTYDNDDQRAHKMGGADVVIVLWSAESVQSDFVKLEVTAASTLVSVYIERLEPQIMGGLHLAVDLSNWTGAADAPEFQRLVTGIRSLREVQGTRYQLRKRTNEDFIDDALSLPSTPPAARKPRGDSSARRTVAVPQRTKVAVNSPRSIGPAWETIRAYLYPEGDESKIQEDAQRLRPSAASQHESGPTSVKIQVGTPITVILDLPGADCRRTKQRFTWRGRWKKTDFEVRYVGEPVAEPQAGNISWFAGIVCIGQLSFQVQFTKEPQKASGSPSLATAPGYESVFVSYSTKDSTIVDWLETTYTALGMTYLRDIKALRSGETWNSQLLKLIERADLFQLCWSANAKKSSYVTDEWKFALGMQKANFIRPCYWEDPMPEPPPDLRQLHFARLKLGWFTRTWFRLRARFG